MKTLVSISGYNYTGASAVMDLLREYDRTCIVSPEIAFSYLPDGLLDLDYHMNHSATYFNGDVAVHRFIQLCNRCEIPKEKKKEFLKLVDHFVDDITELTWVGSSSFDGTRLSNLEYPVWKMKRLFSILVFHFFKKTIRLNERTMVLAHHSDVFGQRVELFLNNVMSLLAPNGDICVFNQFFSAFQPDLSMKYIDNAKTIVVDRDPRDVYILGHIRHETGCFPSHNADDFITWYKSCWSNRQKMESKKTLFVQFEDLVHKYDFTVERIENFLGLSEHAEPKKYFNPDISINNTQLKWRFPQLSNDISKIELSLSDFLYPFEDERKPTGTFF